MVIICVLSASFSLPPVVATQFCNNKTISVNSLLFHFWPLFTLVYTSGWLKFISLCVPAIEPQQYGALTSLLLSDDYHYRHQPPPEKLHHSTGIACMRSQNLWRHSGRRQVLMAMGPLQTELSVDGGREAVPPLASLVVKILEKIKKIKARMKNFSQILHWKILMQHLHQFKINTLWTLLF